MLETGFAVKIMSIGRVAIYSYCQALLYIEVKVLIYARLGQTQVYELALHLQGSIKWRSRL